ncbi:MAG: deoxyhypusine synthase family protein [Chloroflexota bacterium]|nr:deoxyhypusine synthase family protein [Chloroflexota bacterium]
MPHKRKPVVPFPITPGCTVSELVQRMAGTSFQARNLAGAVNVWSHMLTGNRTIFLGLSGAMIPAGMREVMAYLIENRLIDCLISTGANLVHDLHETLGRVHWQGHHNVDDVELANEDIFRIYDTFLEENAFDDTERFIIDFSATLDQDRPYTTREFFYRLGSLLCDQGQGNGIITAAAKANMPIYCPAIVDSVYGTALADARVKGKSGIVFDLVKDLVELIQVACAAEDSGVIFIGGGTPKNFIQQIELCGDLFDKDLKGHEYAIQITTDSPQWGGLSGCTFEEARSWGKIQPEASTATVYADATIALPIIVSALSEGSADIIKNRVPPAFEIGREITVR